MMKKLLTLIAFALVTFTANAQVMGDVNGDDDVNVTDVTLIVAYIMGQQNENFIAANADVNGDGSITVTDVTKLVSIILEGSNNGNPDDPENPEYTLSCPDNHHPHAIDLGLPSGTKWACCNVGANTPEGYGGYYAWGETSEKDYYQWSTYTHCDGSSSTCHNLGSDIAGTQYDVAHVKWGGSWVMPSHKQQVELLNNCSDQWTQMNGVNGMSFTDHSSGGTIFLPAAGYRAWEDLFDNGSWGVYWSSTQNPSRSYNAYGLGFIDNIASWNNYGYARALGRPVRPVWVP